MNNISYVSTAPRAISTQSQPKEEPISSINTAAINKLFDLDTQILFGEITPKDAYYKLLNLTDSISAYLPFDLQTELKNLRQDLIGQEATKSGEQRCAHELREFAKKLAKALPPPILAIQGASDFAHDFSYGHSSLVTLTEKLQIIDFLKREIVPILGLEFVQSNLPGLWNGNDGTPEQVANDFKHLVSHLESPLLSPPFNQNLSTQAVTRLAACLTSRAV